MSSGSEPEQLDAVVLAPCFSPPPAPKMCSSWPQFEQTWVLMFSTMPRIGMLTFSNILRPLRASMQRDVLRRGDDHRAGHRHLLRERELDVAGARRHVDDQVVEVAPVRLAEQLLERLGHHRAAPDHRLLRRRSGSRSTSPGCRGRPSAPASCRRGEVGRCPAMPEHDRLRRTVDVGVEHAHRRALGGEREREVHRDGGLAHAALAGGDRDDVADAGDAASRRAAPRARRSSS